MAAGPAEHSPAQLIGPSADDGRLVIVLRDAHRYESARDQAAELLSKHPDAVVVETGLPRWRPAAARGFIATHGAGRANLEAAAEVIRGRR
jgi:beta-N-acetylhexosaminidase